MSGWFSRGNTLYFLKRYEESVQNHDKVISLSPNFAEAWSERGNSLSELECYEDALKSQDKALAIKATNQKFQKNRELTQEPMLQCQKTQCPSCAYKTKEENNK